MSNALVIRLEGAEGETSNDVRLDDLTLVCDRLQKALKQIERSVTAQKPKYVYSIRSLKSGSAVVELDEHLQNDLEYVGESPFSVFVNAVAQIAEDKPLDNRIDWMALEHMKQLARPVSRGTAKSVEIHGLSIGPWFSKKIDLILKDIQESRGSVKGTLEKVNVHSGNQFEIYPRFGTTYIKCRFPESLLGDVRRAIGRDVTVYGILQTMRGRRFPMSALVERLDIHPSDEKLPSLMSMKGIARGKLPAAGGVATIRAIRDAQEKEAV